MGWKVRAGWVVPVLCLPVLALSPADSASPLRGEGNPQVAGRSAENDLPPTLRNHGFITADKAGRILIDTAHAPDDLESLLGAAEDAGELEGRTVVFEGLPAQSSDEARQRDRDQFNAEGGSADTSRLTQDACDALPSIPDGPVRAYVGCDPAAGYAFEPISGAPGQVEALEVALGRSLVALIDEQGAGALPEVADIRPEVRLTDDGVMSADFPIRFEEYFDPTRPAIGGEAWRWLSLTAMTLGPVQGVTYRIDGDCLRFALATNGDMCTGVIGRSELEGGIFQ